MRKDKAILKSLASQSNIRVPSNIACLSCVNWKRNNEMTTCDLVCCAMPLRREIDASLLWFGNPVQRWRLLTRIVCRCWPCILCRGRSSPWGPWQRRAVRRQPVMSKPGKVWAPPGVIHYMLGSYARVVITVCAWDEDGLVAVLAIEKKKALETKAIKRKMGSVQDFSASAIKGKD